MNTVVVTVLYLLRVLITPTNYSVSSTVKIQNLEDALKRVAILAMEIQT